MGLINNMAFDALLTLSKQCIAVNKSW